MSSVLRAKALAARHCVECSCDARTTETGMKEILAQIVCDRFEKEDVAKRNAQGLEALTF